MTTRPKREKILNKATVPKPGEHYGVPRKPYVYRGNDTTDGAKQYLIDGFPHRFDGTCHAECEDVR